MIKKHSYDNKNLVLNHDQEQDARLRTNKVLSKEELRDLLVAKAAAFGAVANGTATNDDGELFLEFLFDQNTSACFHGYRHAATSALVFKIDVYRQLWVMPVVYYDGDYDYNGYGKGERVRKEIKWFCTSSMHMPKKVGDQLVAFLDTLNV